MKFQMKNIMNVRRIKLLFFLASLTKVDMNGDGIIDNGTSTITNTWENGNLKTTVSKYLSPSYIHIDTVIYEYDTLLNKPCSQKYIESFYCHEKRNYLIHY